MTMNNTWGYKEFDNAWKSSETLIRNLIKIAARGGNYLLNIGPKPNGTFPEESVRRLEEIGKWMKVNGEAVYGTKASPVETIPWGECTMKEDMNNTILYLSVFNWPKDGKLAIPGVKNKVVSARLLATGAKLTTIQAQGGTVIKVPEAAPDTIASVIKLKVKGKV